MIPNYSYFLTCVNWNQEINVTMVYVLQTLSKFIVAFKTTIFIAKPEKSSAYSTKIANHTNEDNTFF